MTDKNERGRPPKYNDPQELQQAVDDYFANEGKEKPTVAGLALALGFSSTASLYSYRDSDKEAISESIKKALLKVEQSHEVRMHSSQCVGSIFALKNIAGWSDKQEVVHSHRLDVSGALESILQLVESRGLKLGAALELSASPETNLLPAKEGLDSEQTD